MSARPIPPPTAEGQHCRVVCVGRSIAVMQIRAPRLRYGVGSALLMLLSGCLQGDQTLPFDVGGDGSAQVDIGDSGGVVSLLPAIAILFPAGSFAGVVTVQPLDGPFPDAAGVPVLGTAFDIEPAGTTLAVPARVELNVPIGGLQPGDEVRLAVGVARSDGSVVAFQGTYDITNGILTAEIDELGPVAAIVFADAIPVAEVVFDNDDGSSEVGRIVAHVRLQS
jgi:hypothetical protein